MDDDEFDEFDDEICEDCGEVHPMMEFPFMQALSPEQRKKLQDEAQKTQLKILEFQRGLYSLFSELSESELTRLRDLLKIIAEGEHSNEAATYWVSWAEHELLSRFDKHPVGSAVSDDALKEFVDGS